MDILFLPSTIRDTLISNGVDLNTLTRERLSQLLTSTDMHVVHRTTHHATMALCKLGINILEDTKEEDTLVSSNDIDVSFYKDFLSACAILTPDNLLIIYNDDAASASNIRSNIITAYADVHGVDAMMKSELYRDLKKRAGLQVV